MAKGIANKIISIANKNISNIESYNKKLKAEEQQYLNCRDGKANPEGLKLDKDLHQGNYTNINEAPYIDNSLCTKNILQLPIIQSSTESANIQSRFENAQADFTKAIHDIQTAKKEAEDAFANDLIANNTTIIAKLSEAQKLYGALNGYWENKNLSEAEKKSQEIKNLSTNSKNICDKVKNIKPILNPKNQGTIKSIEEKYNAISRLAIDANGVYSSMKSASENGRYAELTAFKKFSPEVIEQLSSFTKEQLIAVKKIEDTNLGIVRGDYGLNLMILAFKNVKTKENLDLLANFLLTTEGFYQNQINKNISLFEALCKVEDTEKLKALLNCHCIRELHKDCIAALSAIELDKMKILVSQKTMDLDKDVVTTLADLATARIQKFIDTFKEVFTEDIFNDGRSLSSAAWGIIANMGSVKWPILAGLPELGKVATRKLKIFKLVKAEHISLYDEVYKSLGVGLRPIAEEKIEELEKITDFEKLKRVLHIENLLSKDLEEIKKIVAENSEN